MKKTLIIIPTYNEADNIKNIISKIVKLNIPDLAILVTLVKVIDEIDPPRPIHGVLGVMKDKDWDTMIAEASGAMDRLWVTIPPSAPPDRVLDLETVADLRHPVETEPDFQHALESAGADNVRARRRWQMVYEPGGRLHARVALTVAPTESQ